MFTSVKKRLTEWYLRYELATHISMLEPWERNLTNTIVVALLCLVSVSSFVYFPTYLERLVHVLTTTVPLPDGGLGGMQLQKEDHLHRLEL